MGRRRKKTSILVTEKVYIKKAALSGFWHYYFSLDGKQFRKSAKTEDETKAKQMALNAYHEDLERKYFQAQRDRCRACETPSCPSKK